MPCANGTQSKHLWLTLDWVCVHTNIEFLVLKRNILPYWHTHSQPERCPKFEDKKGHTGLPHLRPLDRDLIHNMWCNNPVSNLWQICNSPSQQQPMKPTLKRWRVYFVVQTTQASFVCPCLSLDKKKWFCSRPCKYWILSFRKPLWWCRERINAIFGERV